MAHSRATNALEEVVRVANLQEERLLAISAEERRSRLMNPRLDTMIRTHKELLLSVQEILFDVGLNDYRRHVPWDHIVTVETRRAEREARAVEAVRKAEEILAKRLGKRSQAGSHLKDRTTNAATCPPADCSRNESRAEPLGAVSSGEVVPDAFVLE